LSQPAFWQQKKKAAKVIGTSVLTFSAPTGLRTTQLINVYSNGRKKDMAHFSTCVTTPRILGIMGLEHFLDRKAKISIAKAVCAQKLLFLNNHNRFFFGKETQPSNSEFFMNKQTCQKNKIFERGFLCACGTYAIWPNVLHTHLLLGCSLA
jgi:hypothetical protein